jgi:hypothetical protein
MTGEEERCLCPSCVFFEVLSWGKSASTSVSCSPSQFFFFFERRGLHYNLNPNGSPITENTKKEKEVANHTLDGLPANNLVFQCLLQASRLQTEGNSSTNQRHNAARARNRRKKPEALQDPPPNITRGVKLCWRCYNSQHPVSPSRRIEIDERSSAANLWREGEKERPATVDQTTDGRTNKPPPPTSSAIQQQNP